MKARAVILAAGEGQRLRPFTRYKPKVMVPVANRPILQYVIEALKKNGIGDIVIVVGYRRQQIFDYFGAGEKFSVNLEYVVQEQQLGTAHALRQAREKVAGDFLVISGDNIVDHEVIGGLLAADGPGLVVREQANASKYGVVLLEDGMVRQIIEKPAQAPTNLVNIGIYRLTQEVFDFIGDEVRLTSVLQNMVEGGWRLSARRTEGLWLDAVYPWDILKLNLTALQRVTRSIDGQVEEGVYLKGDVSLGRGTVVRANSYIVGPAVIGSGCEIGPGVCIFPGTSIGNNVCVFPFTEVRNSIIADGVQVGTGSTIHDSLIDRGCVLGAHFMAASGEAELNVDSERHKVSMGTMLGEGCRIDEGVVVRPGVVIGNGARVGALKVLRENIPDDALVV